MNSAATETSRGYFICSIEGSGGDLLAAALAQTEVAGRPKPYFGPMMQQTAWMRSILGDSTVITGLPRILRAATTPNGVFGALLQWSHLRYLARSLNNQGAEVMPSGPGGYLAFLSQLPKLIPTGEFLDLLRARAGGREGFAAAYHLLLNQIPGARTIWIRRENRVARAVSHTLALHANESVADPRYEFDLAQIHQDYCLGLFQEESWEWLFKELEISPCLVTYEDLIANTEATVRAAFSFLEFDDAVKIAIPSLLLPGTEGSSVEWEQRYSKLSAEMGL